MKQVKGKIILIDDEKYEKDLLESALKQREWDIKVDYFADADKALEHLKENADEIFLIISDMNMLKKDGMELKKEIDQDDYLRAKSIPFIFASNAIDMKKVVEAYKYRVQGYFQKPLTPEGQADMLETIIRYWIACVHPCKDDLPVLDNIKKNNR